MNERIHELIKEATEFQKIPYDGIDGVYREAFVFNKEKFAELIVRECADIVADAVDHREPASTYVEKIKQHFGVEE